MTCRRNGRLTIPFGCATNLPRGVEINETTCTGRCTGATSNTTGKTTRKTMRKGSAADQAGRRRREGVDRDQVRCSFRIGIPMNFEAVCAWPEYYSFVTLSSYLFHFRLARSSSLLPRPTVPTIILEESRHRHRREADKTLSKRTANLPITIRYDRGRESSDSKKDRDQKSGT